MFVLDVAEKNVVEHRDHVDVEDSILQWYKEEVYKLSWRPDEPICQVDCWKLLFQNVVRLMYGFSRKEKSGIEIMSNKNRTDDDLKCK